MNSEEREVERMNGQDHIGRVTDFKISTWVDTVAFPKPLVLFRDPMPHPQSQKPASLMLEHPQEPLEHTLSQAGPWSKSPTVFPTSQLPPHPIHCQPHTADGCLLHAHLLLHYAVVKQMDCGLRENRVRIPVQPLSCDLGQII